MPPPAGSVGGKGDGCASGLVVDDGVVGIEAMVGVMVGVPVEAVAGLVVVGAEGLAWGGPRAQAGVAVLVPLALSPSYRVLRRTSYTR